MKKFFYSFFAAATLMFAATSCSQEEMIGNETSGNEVEVSFNVDMEGQQASRAIGDGLTVDEVVMAVYDVDSKDAQGNWIIGEEVTKLRKTETVSNLGAVVKVRLVKGQTYAFVFWAQKKGAGHYDLTDMKAIKVNNYTTAANDESRDAFYNKVDPFTVSGPFSQKVTLKRPFAQLNLGTTAEDIEWAMDAGVEITHSKVSVTGAVYTTLNPFTGVASGAATVNFESAEVPDAYEEELVIKDDKNLFANDIYEYLASDYLLANAESELSTTITYELYNKTEKINTLTIENAPLQRNWRTNIVGEILTGEGTFNIVIDPIFTNDHNYPMDYSDLTIVSTKEQFEAAIANAKVKVIGLEKDFEYDGVQYLKSSPKTIYSMYPEHPATISGKFIAHQDVTFKNIVFKPSANSMIDLNKSTYNDRQMNGSYKSIVNVINVAATFEGCSFIELHQNFGASAINYFMEASNKVLKVNNCSFKGITKAIYSKVLCEVTNSKFDLNGGVALYVWPRANGEGHVDFIGNENMATAQAIAVGLLSQTAKYDNVKFNVQNNSGNWNSYAAVGAARFNPNGVAFAAGSDKFSVTADGKFGTNSELTIYSAEELANVINNATADITVNLGKDIEGDAILHQKENVNVVINGKDYKYVGTIEIDGDARQAGLESLTIDNVNFVTNSKGEIFIDSNENTKYGKKYNYAHNVIVKNCSFTATDEGMNTAVAMKYRASKNMTVINCTTIGLHSLLQGYGVNGITLDGADVEGGKNGISLGTSTNVNIKNSNIAAAEYGIRGGETNGASGELVVENSTISAKKPIIIRGVGKSTGIYAVTLKGQNTLTASEAYQIVFTNGNDDVAYVAPAVGTYSIMGADGMTIFK